MVYTVEIDLLRMRHCSFVFHDLCEELQPNGWQAERKGEGLECFCLKPQMESWERLVMENAWVA
jgi:hypothetical protein